MRQLVLLAALGFLVLSVAFTYSVIFNKIPAAHAQDIETKSDHEQEVAYCKAWDRNQTHITGPHISNMAVAEHCKQYLKK